MGQCAWAKPVVVLVLVTPVEEICSAMATECTDSILSIQ
jgi:hypothetical protein